MATEVASLTALLSLDDSGFQRGMQNAESTIQRAGGGMRGLGTSLQSVGSSLTSVGGQFALATAPIAAFGVAGVAVASQYQNALTEIQVRAGLTVEELDAIRETTLRLGQETQYGPGQAAEAFLQLMTSGYSAEQAMASIDTVMAGAAATGADLGYTADALTDILAAMGLDVEHSADVMQTLVNATGASSATFNSLVDGFGNVGPVAANFGLSVEQTAATLAVFSENGIKGAEAGTQLRSMLNNMTRPTKAVQDAWDALGTSFYNADGNRHGGLGCRNGHRWHRRGARIHTFTDRAYHRSGRPAGGGVHYRLWRHPHLLRGEYPAVVWRPVGFYRGRRHQRRWRLSQ